MSVFNGTPANQRAVPDPGKDHALPASKALGYGSITSATGLGGTTGVDVKLIHGDRWQEIKGNQTENIEKDLKTHIKENEEWTIDENLTYKVGAKTEDTRTEDYKQYFHAHSFFEYFEKRTEYHHESDHLINPTHTFEIFNVEGEFKTVDLAVKATSFEAKGTSVEAVVLNAEGLGATAEAFGAKVEAGGFANGVCAFDVQERAANAEAKEFSAKLHAVEVKAGGPKTLIMPIRIGICIGVHIDSPFA